MTAVDENGAGGEGEGTVPDDLGRAGSPAAAGRRARAGAALRRHVGAALVGLVGVGVVFRPWRLDLRHALPSDLGDPAFIVWTLRWVAAALTAHPRALFDANIFWPHRSTLAYSESLIPQAVPFGAVYRLTGNQVLAHNLTLLLLFVVAVVATNALARRLLGRGDAALVAAVAFAFTGFAVSHVSHLQITTHGLVALALLTLLRLLERPTWTRAVAAALATAVLVLASLYFGAIWGLCAGAVVVAALATRRPVGRAVDRDTIRGLVVFGATTAVLVTPFVLPYVSLSHERTLERGLSLRLGDLFAPPSGSRWTGRIGPVLPVAEHVFFAGFTVLALAAAGAVAVLTAVLTARTARTATVAARRRAGDVVAGPGLPPAGGEVHADRPHRGLSDGALVAIAAVVSLVVALGPQLGPVPGPFRALHAAVPGFSSIRAVSRMAVVALLGLALLAGRGYAWVADRLTAPLTRWAERTGRETPAVRAARAARPVLAVLTVSGVLLELAAPWPPVVVPRDPAVVALHKDLASRPRGAVVVLPVARPEASVPVETLRMLASTEDWFPRFNGYSGFWPPGFTAQADTFNSLPSDAGWALVRALRIRYLIVTDPVRARRLVSALPVGAEVRRYGGSILVQLAGGVPTPADARAAIAAELERHTIVDGSFEQGGTTWFVYNRADAGRLAVREGDARSGRRYGRFHAVAANASVATELAVQTAPGTQVRSRLWLRSPHRATVTVALWALCQPAGNASTSVTLGPAWQPVDVALAGAPDACPVRLEVYAGQGTSRRHPLDLDVDDVTVAVGAAS